MKSLVQFLLLAGIASMASAAPIQAPEIDATSATTAVALVAGGVLILRARLRK